MLKLREQFLEASDALALGNPAIIEKDYWVVALLALLEKLDITTHQLVFSGGTALAKSHIKILRMSEDVDIKLIPTTVFATLSRSAKKKSRKAVIEQIEAVIDESGVFVRETKTVRDESRYVEYQLKYPQQFSQDPCLRPIIKLELMETILLHPAEPRAIQSIVAELYKQDKEVQQFQCISASATLVEKVLSMLRRTAFTHRYPERKDDETLVRHIYDVHCICTVDQPELKVLTPMFHKVLQEDIERYGSQHPEFIGDRSGELRMGLTLLEQVPLYQQRFNNFVTPMVYNVQPHNFTTCFASFKRIA